MNRASVIVAALLSLVLIDSAGASARPSSPEAVVARQMVSAVVVLRQQVDPATIRASTRQQRHVAIERALRREAAESQRGILALLSRRRAEGLVTRIVPLWIVNSVAVTAAPSVIRELASRADVREIQPELTIEAPPAPAVTAAGPAEPNVALVNAPALWDLGYRGQDVVVANMDTGVDASHPDLAGRWRGGSNSWYDPNGEHPTTPTDVSGHGTSTMGVIVGGDAGGTSIGVAPDARWIAVKIFNDRGIATSTSVHLGFQWLLDPDGNPDTADAPDVVNNSWTLGSTACSLDFQPDLTNLRSAGILPVFAAGNYGPSPGTVLSPANNPQAFAVGATNNADVIDASSSRGPSACGQALAPRLVAPGVGIHTSDLYGFYVDASGTSLAAPHVAGALALLLSAFPGLSAERQAAALEGGAVDLGAVGPDNIYGSGRLDSLAAYEWLATEPDFTVEASPSTVTTTPGGTASYAVSVAGVNGFAGDVSLALSGLPAALASWSFTPPVVAGGTGTAQLTVTTSSSIAPGTYPLTVAATSGAATHGASVTLVVPAPPDFSLAASPASRTTPAGGNATYNVSVGALNGFTGSVALSLSGLPASVGSATFSPAVVTTAGSAQLAVTTAATASPGTYWLTIAGSSGSTVHQSTVKLVVTPRDFALSVTPSSVTVTRRQTAAFSVSLTSIGGFSGAVALSVTGLPYGTSGTFSPNPVVAPGASQLSVRTSSWTPRGTFVLVITGSDGVLTHSKSVSLIVA